MQRSILIIIILFLSGVIFLGLQNRLNSVPPVQQVESPQTMPISDKGKAQIVNDYNQINSQIRGFNSDEVDIRIWENNKSVISTHGYLRYEKPKNFRFIVKSFFGKELDLGSNESIFWFWGKRSDEKGLFFAVHADYYKTRLKTPFNPIWIMHSLGVDETKSEIYVEGGAIELQTNSFNQIMVNKIYIENSRAKKIEVADTTGKLLIIVELSDYSGNFPQKVVYNWLEENRIMELKFKNPRDIGRSNPDLWKMPDLKPKIDMGKD